MEQKFVDELKATLGEIKTGVEKNTTAVAAQGAEIIALKASVKASDAEVSKMHTEMDEQRRQYHGRKNLSSSVRRPGRVSDDCAEMIGASFVLGCAAKGHLAGGIVDKARTILGVQTKAALTATDIPLPSEFFSQIRELIADFGVARRAMMHFPITGGTVRVPRFKTRQSFGSIVMSAAMTEKSPQIDFASLESHKIGGIVRVPRELDEQSIVPMGQFLMRYGAVEFARAEDTWAFLADATATYELVSGIVKIATANSKIVQLGATKTAPSDAALSDFRLLRTMVNKAGLSGRRSAYYLDSTWETRLPSFKTAAEQFVYTRLPDGSALLDGYPIVWTDVLQAYQTTAAASQPLAVFGALDFWFFGEHGMPRMDFSQDVYFTTDELGTRFIEEIDFDYQQVDATAALITAAG